MKKYEIKTCLEDGCKPAFAKVFIYVLRHPLTEEIRYVGKATDPRARYYRHLWSSRREESPEYKFPVYRWIRKLGKLNLLPEMYVFELTTHQEFEAREKYWISYYRNQGKPILNILEGGQGWVVGRKHTEESKLKMSTSAKKRIYPGWQDKMSLARIGHEVKESTKNKLSSLFKGKKLNHETGKQISKRQKKLWANLSPEARTNQLLNLEKARQKRGM